MWAILMIVLFFSAFAGIIYLINRIGKFGFLNKITKGKKWLRILIIAVLVCGITVILWVAWGSMNAIVCILHLIIFWLISDGIFALIKKRRKKSLKRYYAGAVALVFTIGYLGSGWYLAHHVWETDYQIQTDKEVGSLRVAVFADSHVGTTFRGEGFAEHMKTIEEQHPDVVLIVGDFVDDDMTKEDMIACCKALGELDTTYGVYYVFGNHDKGYYPPEYRGYDGNDLIVELEKNQVHVLQDEVELIADKFSIVLDHQPQDYAAQQNVNVDLVLSGHTHGGQLFPLMTIENLTKMTPDDRVYGYEQRENTNFIVTSGISDWAIKFKTGCKSEYLMIDIEGK